ncbi:uncharacterized protein LOC122254108 [Penaeus japonicus]|uniref:uncharacterized protein LOC122254108 n=1 Tax=Penaeus japonicus TaxID=27405 RepID=UPI001C714D51|nr:uncharacterized protein LOC122254108 [Penaeus japonicus]
MEDPTLSCGVCEELYTKGERRPRALLCGHTFCTLCLDEAIRAKTCNCPSCNQPFIAFTATQLPTDFPTLQKITSSSSSVSGSYGSLARKSSLDTTSSSELNSLRTGFSKLSSTKYEPLNRDSIPENTAINKAPDKEEGNIRSNRWQSAPKLSPLDTTSSVELDSFRTGFSKLSSTRYEPRNRDSIPDTALYKAPDKEEGNIRSNRWQSAQKLSFLRNYTDNKVYGEGNSDETDSLERKQKDLGEAFSKRRTYATSFDHKPLSRADDVLNRNYAKVQPRGNAAHPAIGASSLKSASDTSMTTLKSPEDQSYEHESSRLTLDAGPRARRPSSDITKGKLSAKLDIDSTDTNSLTDSPANTTSTPKHVLRMCRSLTSKHLTSGRDYYPNQARPATPSSDESSDDDMADILGPPPPLPGTGPPALPKSLSSNDQGNLQEGGTTDEKIYESGVSVDTNNTCEGLTPTGNKVRQDLQTSGYDKKNGVQTPTEIQSRSDTNRSLRARLSRRALSLQYALNDDENVSKEPLHFTKSESYNSRSSSVTTPSEEESKENRRKLNSISYHSKARTVDKPEINDTEKETNSVNRSLPQSNSTKKDTSFALSTTPAQDPMQKRREGYEDLRVKTEWKYRTQQEENSNTHSGSREDAGKAHWSDRKFRLSSLKKVENGKMSGRSKSVDEGEKKDISIPSSASKDKVGTDMAKNLWSKSSQEKLEEPHDSFYPDHKKSECSQTQDENKPKDADVSSAITSKDKEGVRAKAASVRDWKIPKGLAHEEQPDDKKTKTSDTSSLKTTSASRSPGRYIAKSSTDGPPIGLLRIGIVPSIQTDGEENEQTGATEDLDTIDSPVMSKGRQPRVKSEGEEALVPKNRIVTGFVSSKRQHENSLGCDVATSSVRYPASKTAARNNFGGKQTLFETSSHDASSDDANIWKNFSRRHRHGEPSKHSDPYAQKNADSEDAAENTYKEQRRYPKLHRTSANDTSKHNKRDPSKQDRAQRVARAHQTSRELKRKTSPTPAVVVLQKLPEAGLCGTHGSIVQLYCQRCEMWICEECLDILHSPSPKGLCRVISTSEALLGLKEKHSEFITSRIDTLSHFRRDLQKLLYECEDSIEEHEATILELRAKAEEEEAQMEGINVLKSLALEKCKQIDTWEDLLQKSAKRIEKSGTSQAMISAVEWNKAEILKKFQENAELEGALSSDFAE